MGNVNDWAGTIGGTLLGLELIVLLLILVAINAGLAFGLFWVLRKTDWVHTKIGIGQGLVGKVVDRGTRVAVMPVIVSTSVWRGLKAGLYRATHWPAVSRPSSMPQPLPSVPDQSRTARQGAA